MTDERIKEREAWIQELLGLAEQMMRDSWATGDDAAWQPAKKRLEDYARRMAPPSEPVAWLQRSKTGMIRCARTVEPTAEDRAIAEIDGDTITPLYAHPPSVPAAGWQMVQALADLYALVHELGPVPDNRYHIVTNAAAALRATPCR